MQAASLLVKVKTSHDALHSLYIWRKSENGRFSYGTMCKRIGLQSKGYLSNLMKGIRPIPVALAKPIATAFDLQSYEADFFVALVKYDNEPLQSNLREELGTEVHRLRKLMTFYFMAAPDIQIDFGVLLKVFSSFGLLQNATREDDFVGLFGEDSRGVVTEALRCLQDMGVVDHCDGKYHLLLKNLWLDTSLSKTPKVDILRNLVMDVWKNLPDWCDNGNQSVYESSFVSVNRKTYEQMIPSLRKMLRKYQSDLETDDGDMLITLNVQMHPCLRL